MTCLCFYSQTYSQRRKHYWVMMRPWPNNRASPSLESCFVWALDGMPSFPTLHEPWMECPCFLHPEVVTLLGTYERCFISLIGAHRITYMPSRSTSHTSFMSLVWHTLVLTLQPALWGQGLWKRLVVLRVVSYQSLDHIEWHISWIGYHHTSFMGLGWLAFVFTLRPTPWGGNTAGYRRGHVITTECPHRLRVVSYQSLDHIEL